MESMYLWFIVSIVFFFLEGIGVSGIGLFFAALAAFCVGSLLQADIIANNAYLAQGAAFFLLTGVWTFMLWKPLKKWRHSRSEQPHRDMIGRFALVADEALVKGKTGRATWSGTLMRARLADEAETRVADIGTELKIVALDGSTLLLAEKDFRLSES